MADFTSGMTSIGDLDDSIITEFEAQFLFSLAEMGTMDQFVTYRRNIGAKEIEIPKYDQLSLATTPLTDKEDPASESVVDSKVTLTPAEHGNTVTSTALVNKQTGGLADIAIPRLIGMNMGRTLNKLAILAADASTNEITVAANVGATVAGDIITPTEMGKMFNRLAGGNVDPLVAGDYILVAHDDVIHDLREGTTVGSWQDVLKYTQPGQILKNEVGMFKGFRVIRDNLSTILVDGGVGSVDVYSSYFLGFNALGKAVSADPQMRITGPFDKLGRFLNVGWFGCLKYLIIEQNALFVLRSSSSVGDNV